MNQDKNNDDPISPIEVSVKNSQSDIRKLFLHSARHEIAIESLDKKVEVNQQENRERFDLVDKRFDLIDKRFDLIDKRFDQLELLIRQLLPSTSN